MPTKKAPDSLADLGRFSEPAVLILISLAAFVAFIVNIWQRGWVLPVVTISLWAFAALAGQIQNTEEVAHRLEAVDGDFAEIVVDGETTGTSALAQGIDLRGTFALEGRFRVSTRDGLRGRGAGSGEVEWTVSGDAAGQIDPYQFFPKRIGVEWCVYRDGEGPRAVGCEDEAPFTLDELFRLDELFVSGTTTDITPIVNVDGRRIGNGKPGPVTKQLYAGLQARLYAGAGQLSS